MMGEGMIIIIFLLLQIMLYVFSKQANTHTLKNANATYYIRKYE